MFQRTSARASAHLILLAASGVSLGWPKLAPAVAVLVLIAWLSGPRGRPLAWVLPTAAILSLAGLTRFVLKEAIPGVIAGGREAAKKHAVATLRSIVAAQDYARRTALLDPDGDRVGSSLTVKELAGLTPLPGGAALDPPALQLGRGRAMLASFLTEGAYLFQVCLPLKGGSFSAEPTLTERDVEAGERRFLVYTWPRASSPGIDPHALFSDEHETILEYQAEPTTSPSFQGVERPPPCDAALDDQKWTPWRNKTPRVDLPGAPAETPKRL